MTLPKKGTHVSWKIQIYWNKHLWETRTPLHYITQFCREQKDYLTLEQKTSSTQSSGDYGVPPFSVSIKGCHHSHRSPNAPRAGGWTGVRGAFRGLVTDRPQNEEPGIQSIDILWVFLIYIVSAFLVPSKLLWNLPVGFNNYSDRHFPYKKVCYC